MKKLIIKHFAPFLLIISFFATKNVNSQTNNCGFFCVNNIYFDSTNTMFVSIVYTGTSFVNYPYVSTIYDLSGAPVASAGVFYFGQLPNTIQDYPVNTSITPPLPQNFTAVIVFNYDTNVCQLLYPSPCGINTNSEIEKIQKIIRVFPNPAENFLNIDFLESKAFSLRIYNISEGRTIKEFYVDEKKHRLDCGDLSPGVYFMEFIENGLIFQREKFIKK